MKINNMDNCEKTPSQVEYSPRRSIWKLMGIGVAETIAASCSAAMALPININDKANNKYVVKLKNLEIGNLIEYFTNPHANPTNTKIPAINPVPTIVS